MLSPDRSVHGLLVLEQGQYQAIRLDVVLPVLHGKFGEDGAMQGLLELSGIPYAGCDVQSSALCMDKSLAYIVVRSAGIATPNFWIVTADESIDPDRFPYPVFVKPARSGSSFGISKVSGKEELPSAVEAARQYDPKVLIEEAVVGSEVGCAILGNDPDLTVGEVDQIRLSHGFFRIHQENKPENGSENSTIIVPADISAEARLLVQETAKAVYRALGCRGLSRVDLFLAEDGKVILNEVNTLPGMTSYSRYPGMMAAAGLPFAEVTKPKHYPNIDKTEMVEKGYVAAKSGHSRGGAIDLTLYRLAGGTLVPMGGDFDLMDSVSHHGAKGITRVEARNRQYLCSIMEACGFISYDCEWWHYILKHEPYPNTYFDFPII